MLTGAVYAFVAYLTAFTLEVLFIIDLAKQNSDQLIASSTATTADLSHSTTGAFDQARLALDSMQTHVTISCLAISILYFVLFIASLILIIAFIIKSTFMLLMWMCVMTTMYLPEFGLIIYVSFQGWGIDTRNGQTELVFYLFRAVLNIIFIFRAHKLYKEWNYEKNFFRLKSGSSQFTGYDSPYFIGDSLTTTINPVFSSSTMNLNRYDHVRDFGGSSHHIHQQHENIYNDCITNQSTPIRSATSRANNQQVSSATRHKQPAGIYVGSPNWRPASSQMTPTGARVGQYFSGRGLQPSSSVLSLNDNESFADCELDLDYRTLTNQQQDHHNSIGRQKSAQSHNKYQAPSHRAADQISITSGSYQPQMGHMSYSTQSLDRRHLKDVEFNMPEQVILRPLGHQPFDYLHRPGSTTKLSGSNISQTQLNHNPATFHNNSRQQQQQQLNHQQHQNNRHDPNKRFTDYNQHISYGDRSRFL